ncbi:hypothetical protein ACWGJT_05130 [Streptomyces xantholiticus]
MISEPEMVPEGHFGAAEFPSQRPSSDDLVAVDDEPAAPRRPPRPAWLWALGGAAVASAVWAGGLYVYGTADPDLGGYRTSRNLCLDAELKALTAAIGERPGDEPGSAWGSTHRTLDEAVCYTDLEPEGYEIPVDEDGNEVGSLPSVSVGYTLHKKIDPGPEFEGSVKAQRDTFGEQSVIRRVDGLGEQAFVLRDSDGVGIHLEVLDGQAVLTLSLTSYWDGDSGEPAVDLSDIEPLLAEDIRALMARLKSQS